MLNLHNDIVKNIDIRKVQRTTSSGVYPGKPIKNEKEIMLYGRDCFKFFYSMFRTHYNPSKEKDHVKRITAAQKGLYVTYQNDLGHYFRYLYTIIKFIDGSEIQDKKRYTNIVRAQLSSHELLMFFYNGLSDYGNERFKPLIEKYQLLKNMPFEDLLDQKHKPLYKNSAYQ